MRKVVYLSIISLCLTSCTIEDVINYLNGQTNNLTQEQKTEVEAAKNSSQNQLNTTSTSASDIIIIPEDDVERDKGGGRP